MTTDKEALQKIFEAALKAPDPVPQARPPKPNSPSPQPAASSPSPQGPPPRRQPAMAASAPKRSFAGSGSIGLATLEAPSPRRPIKPACNQVVMPEAQPKKSARFKGGSSDTKTPNLDAAAADELGALLDAKIAKDRQKRKRAKIIAWLSCLGAVAGAGAWIAQNPQHVETAMAALREIRSAGDVKALVNSYQDSLDEVSVRGQQLDQATMTLGASAELAEGEDAHMDQEMQAMMGGEGKTLGARSKALTQSFGDRSKEAGGIIVPKKKISEEDSFSF